MPLTGLDFILIAFMLVSALLAMMRGLTREVLSILSWAAAAAGTLLIYPRFREFARDQVQPEWLADIGLVAGSFLIILVVVSVVTVRLSDLILDSRVGALDRTFGFVFGLGRGLLLVVIAILFVNWFMPSDRQPRWIAEARSKPMLENAGQYIISLLPEDPEGALMKRLPSGLGNEAAPEEQNDASVAPSDSGYRNAERRSLDQVVESTSRVPQ